VLKFFIFSAISRKLNLSWFSKLCWFRFRSGFCNSFWMVLQQPKVHPSPWWNQSALV